MKNVFCKEVVTKDFVNINPPEALVNGFHLQIVSATILITIKVIRARLIKSQKLKKPDTKQN
jgi:hypothetical protein